MKTLSTIALATLVLLVFGMLVALPVMLLWNWLIPDLFGLPYIGWWQAWGLLFLCSLLFKNVGGSRSS